MMTLDQPKQQRHVTYKKREVAKFKQMEEELMNEHCVTFSDLVKMGIRKLYDEYKATNIKTRKIINTEIEYDS